LNSTGSRREEVGVDPTMIVVGLGGALAGAAAVWLTLRARLQSLEALRLLDEQRALAEAAEREARAVTASTEAESRIAAMRSTIEADAADELRKARARLLAEGDADRRRLALDEERLATRAEELERHAVRAERRQEDLAQRETKIAERERQTDARAAEVARMHESAVQEVERIAGLSQGEARQHLLAEVEAKSRSVLARRVQELEEAARERAETTAKNIISMAIQRYAGEYVCERTVSVVNLPSEELKGRIIGREGRNIRALEAATGVDFIIDDTPQCIVISAFNPIRREVARRTLETLLEDGRIHPSRVESVARKTEAEFHKIIRQAGQEAADEVGVSGIHPEILKLVGALKYRTSYGQNQWQHALEVAFLCGSMAAELGLDERRARRAGLLHDIGKVLDQTAEGSHALIGAEFARKHGEAAVIVNAIASHHEEVPQETVYACLAQAADAISGARPGARRQMMQSYTQRLSDLERISNSFPGVERSYAVQAGREVRVIVENGRISDEDAVVLSHEIAEKIESEMAYPGQIKVTVIRETRIVNYAR
jgi:ribonuclease Y